MLYSQIYSENIEDYPHEANCIYSVSNLIKVANLNLSMYCTIQL